MNNKNFLDRYYKWRLFNMVGWSYSFYGIPKYIYAIEKGTCPDMAFLWRHTYSHPGTAASLPQVTWSRFVEHTPACVVAKGVIENDPLPPTKGMETRTSNTREWL